MNDIKENIGNTPAIGMEIVGVGTALPSRMVSSLELAEQLREEGAPQEIDFEWIVSKTGILTRPRIRVELGESTESLGVQAGKKAINSADIELDQVKSLIVASSTNPQQVPGMYNSLQDHFGLRNIFGTDISSACSGFVNGIVIAEGLLATGNDGDCAMVVGTDAVSTVLKPGDYYAGPIFADGASAVILKRVDGSKAGVLGKASDNRGEHRGHFIIEHGGYIQMNGEKLHGAIGRLAPDVARLAVQRAGLEQDNVDMWVPHQSNGYILGKFQKRMNIPNDKFAYVIDHLGNASAASTGLAFAEMVRRGRIRAGSIVALAGLAIGASGTTAVMRMPNNNIFRS